MFDIDNLMHLGVFNQLIPIWQVFFFIAGLLPFLLMDRVKICLLITYLFHLLPRLHGSMGRISFLHRLHATFCPLLT